MIEFTDVRKSYSGQRVLQGVNLQIPAGDFLVLMGESGSGKSTFLNLAAGIERPDSGKIHIGKTDITTLSDDALTRLRRTKIGFIFQFFNLLPTMSVWENVAIPLMLRQGLKADPEPIRFVLDQVGLANKTDRRVHELSGGEQQRVAIARALVSDPEVIIADEPTGSLDRRTGEQILEIIRNQVHSSGRTVVMATHSERVARAADRILSIRDGLIV